MKKLHPELVKFYENNCPSNCEECQYIVDKTQVTDPFDKAFQPWTHCKKSRAYQCKNPEHPTNKASEIMSACIKAEHEAFVAAGIPEGEEGTISFPCKACNDGTMTSERYKYNGKLHGATLRCDTCQKNITLHFNYE